MKKYLILLTVFFSSMLAPAQSFEKIKVTSHKMGDGLYDFYAENPNALPFQIKFWFTEFENMTASTEIPFVSTIQPGKQYLLEVRRTFIDLPGSFQYKYSTRPGAFPVQPFLNASYVLPVAKEKETKVKAFDFSKSRTPQKITWGFEMNENDTIFACREGIVGRLSTTQMRDSLKVGENSVTLLHIDQTMGKYEPFADHSFIAELGDTVFAGDPLGIVLSENVQNPLVRFSVYYVNASIDSIEAKRLRNFHTYLSPKFIQGNGAFIKLENNSTIVP